MASQAEPGKEARRVLKASLFIFKRPDISEEEFHRYWSEQHGPLLSNIQYVKEKILKYNQYHSDTASKNKAASLGLPVMEFDGAAEVWAEDVETVLGILKDPEYIEKIVPDEKKFVSPDGAKFMFGYEVLSWTKPIEP